MVIYKLRGPSGTEGTMQSVQKGGQNHCMLTPRCEYMRVVNIAS